MRPSMLVALALTAAPAVAAPAAPAAEWPDLSTSPKGAREGVNDAALIIAIEDYAKVGDVAGAGANADDWVGWLLAGRGVPAARIVQVRDADATDVAIRREAARVATLVKPGGTLWVLYVGHGAPGRDGRDGLLVGVDADRSAEGIYARSVPQKELFALLDRGAQAQTVAVVDACFSGQAADGAELVAGLQPLVPLDIAGDAPPARTRVLTATGPGEFSGPLPGVSRPAFSYLALGALRGWADADGGNGDGKVSASEVRDWVAGALGLTVRGRKQTPGLLGDDAVLGRALDAQAPDLAALARSGRAPQAVARVTVDAGGASADTTTDYADIAAKAAAAKAKREKAERDAAEAAVRAAAEAQARAEAEAAEQARLEAELGRRRRAELDRQAGEVKAKAARDYAALAPLLTGEVTPETKPVLQAYVKQYGDVTVRFDGVVEEVEIAEVAKVERVLGSASSGKMGYAMVRIAPGTFTMGSPATEKDRGTDEAEHRVTLTKAFLMGTTEVTQGLWTKVMGSNPSEAAYEGVSLVGDALPVQNVSWCDAVVFANKLSALEGLTPAYGNASNCAAVTWNRAANGYRLPTEAEWEYAARAGTKQVYAGATEAASVCRYGNVADSRAKSKWSDWTTFPCDDGVVGPAPVGRCAPNAWGLHDMTGNVWEWTWDWKGDYGGAVTDPTGASSGSFRVYRGGSWNGAPRSARVANRDNVGPGRRGNGLGLRLSRTVP